MSLFFPNAFRPQCTPLFGLLLVALAGANLPAAETIHELVTASKNTQAEAMIAADMTLLNQRNAQQQTPLFLACARGNAVLAAWLINKGADIEAADSVGITPVMIAAQINSLTCVKLLVEKGANIHAKDRNGRDAMGAAYSHPWQQIVDYLKQAEATDTPHGAAPVLADDLKAAIAANDDAKVKTLIKATPQQLYGRDDKGHSVVILAAMASASSAYKELIASDAYIAGVDADGWTALHHAAETDSETIAKGLLAKGADPTVKDKQGRTALDIATARGKTGIIALLRAAPATVPPVVANPTAADNPASPVATPELIKAVTDNRITDVKAILAKQPELVNSGDGNGFPEFTIAAGCGYDQMLPLFLDAGVNIDILDKEGMTALIRAAKNGSLPCVKLLVARGANIYIKEPGNFYTAEAMATYRKHPDIADFLKGVAAGTVSAGGPGGLVLAIGRGDLAQVESLVKTTPALAVQPDPNGRTPLHLAMTSKCEIAGYLVAQKADVNKGDFENWRPIHVAAEAGRADMVKLLLENEADPNSTATQTAQTPLYIAAVYGFTEVARNLLAAHANPNLNNSRGVSPLHRAAESGYIDIVSLLILAKAEINAKDQVGKTPLDYAITANRPEIIGLLVKYGATGSLPVPAVLPPAATPAVPGAIGARKADPNAKLDPVQEKAFIDACANCDGAKMDELLKADLNLAYSKTPPDNGAYNGLHLIPCSTVKGTPALAAKILDLGVPVDIRNGWQRTPLCRAAEMGNPQMVGYYLDKGADVNAVDGSGWTPLYAVSQAGDAETYVKCVNFLLDHKADATIKDKLKNETAYAAAKRSGNLQVVAAFEARGMKE